MKAIYEKFGVKKMCPVVVYLNNSQIQTDTWDVDYWIERPEEWYGLMATDLKDKKVRVMTREEWMRN